MNPLFSRSSLMILESLTFTQTLYAFDFDGTLSPIVRVPSEAKISKITSELLRKLSERAPVAIVSGRGIEDLKKRLPFAPQYLIGNHGLEGVNDGMDSLKKAQEVCTAWRVNFAEARFVAGVEVEDKTYSLAIHYRRSRSKTQARAQIENVLQSLTPPPRIVAGKSVVNLLPPGAPHKGIALLELMRKTETRNAFYIGDDDTDEDVFSVSSQRIMTVRVGKKNNSKARYYIGRQSEINRLLSTIIGFYEKTQKNKARKQ